jgi:probable phosphoglycerate mutase
VKLILVRHGLPERQEVTEGPADPHLAPRGQEQAEQVANWLAGEHIDAVYSSTMNRARQTAEPYAALANLPINQRDGLVEYDRKAASYVPMEELRRDDPEAWQAFVSGGYNDHLDIHQFHATVVNTLEEVITAHAGQTVAVFCHGGVINVWTAHVLGMTPRLFFEPRYTSIHRYLCARSGERNVESLNECAHLRGRDLL